MPISRNAMVATTALIVATIPVRAQNLALEELLARAADYHASYVSRVSGVTLEERYGLIQLIAGRMQTPVRFASDVVLVNVNGRLIGLRDPFAVDNVPLRERTPRITALLAEPTTQSWDRAQAHAREQDFRFLSDLILTLNDPALALQFISRDVQPKLTLKIERQETMNGIPVMRVGFSEIAGADTKFLLGTRGNASAAGRLWIDPLTGAVHKTELRATSATESVVVTVSYARDTALDLWLPQKMNETYQWKELNDVASNRNVGAYGARLFFQADASYTNARYTPVDLSRMRR